MKKEIYIKKKRIEYSFKRCCFSKSLRLIARANGCLIITAPPKVSLKKIESFLQEKSAWVLDKIKQVERNKKKTNFHNEKSDYQRKKDEAQKILSERVAFWANKIKVSYRRINIRNQQTRWGSCSRKGNLNFHYRVAFLPENLSNYIIVHELCHRKEFNHSPAFWSLVKNFLPNYQSLRKEIRKFNF